MILTSRRTSNLEFQPETSTEVEPTLEWVTGRRRSWCFHFLGAVTRIGSQQDKAWEAVFSVSITSPFIVW